MMVAHAKDGLAAARARGRLGERNPKLSDAQKAQVKKLCDAKELTISELEDDAAPSPPLLPGASRLAAPLEPPPPPANAPTKRLRGTTHES